MTRLAGCSFWLAALALVGMLPASSDAFGGRRNRCESSCAPSCAPACAPVCESAPIVPAPMPEVKYEERKVTYQKPVWKDKVIEETIVRCVPRNEKVVYDVQVPTYRDEKRTVKVCRPVTRQEEYVCKVAYPVNSVEKRTVTTCAPVWSDVEYTYNVCVPKFRTVTRSVPFCTWDTKTVECSVPVCRVVPEVCTDACGRCYTVCRTVTEMQTVTRCVRVPVHGTREVQVNECYYETETRKGVRKVCNFERREQVVDVPVCRMEYRDEKRSRTVCSYETVDQEVTVRVCGYETQKREGVRCVMDRVEEKVSRTVKVCEYETVTETVRVAVGGGCVESSCGYISTGCDSGCFSGGRRGRRCR